MEGNQSIREMAEAQAKTGDGDDPGELFPIGTLPGDDLTLRELIKPHHKVEVTASLMAAEVPMTGGLVDPEREGMALVTYELAKPLLIPQREGDRDDKKLVGWKVRQQLRPVYVEGVRGEAGVIEAQFAALLKADQQQAAALADRIRARLQDALA